MRAKLRLVPRLVVHKVDGVWTVEPINDPSALSLLPFRVGSFEYAWLVVDVLLGVKDLSVLGPHVLPDDQLTRA